jgi:UDP-N-acetylglucosamine 2-epimerase (non-hydrolysing)/GDP/UDP-N,N'-diacetylbacillosamine 2-epimerase (hydrolysing)
MSQASEQRKIAVVTGSRAEYGLLRWLMHEIQSDARLALQVVATGMHLAAEFGMTVNDIVKDGFKVDETVESQLSSDSKVGMVKSLGLGTISMADALRRLAPDVVVLLGDRYEILAAAQAAALMGIPVAHISGGEVTEGAVDDWIRHAITKASWWHFPGNEAYRQRIIQLGESPERVFNVGDPGLDHFKRLQLLDRAALGQAIGINVDSPLFLVTYHPATLGDLPPTEAFRQLLDALDAFPHATVVLTKPNADAGGRELAVMADQWAEANSGRAVCFTSMGQLRYLSAMMLADVVIGNSSSGIVEAPAAKVPTVNIGPRQDGRLKAASIIDCAEESGQIVAAIELASSPAFRERARSVTSLYGDCDASAQIKRILAETPLPRVLKKGFHDL